MHFDIQRLFTDLETGVIEVSKQRDRLHREVVKRREQASRSHRERSKRGLDPKDHDARFRKNLARGKPLPPGIAKRDLSGPFLGKLPSHKDYTWQMAGTDLVLLSRSDKIVREIVRDVFK